MASNGIEVARAYVTIIPSMEGSQKAISKELGVAVESEGKKSGKTLGSKMCDGLKDGLKSIPGHLADITGKAFKAAATTAAAGIAAITTQAVKSFADYEQLAGGVEKIFSNMDTSTIMKDASEAYKNLNMSANDYLESINNVGAMFKSTMGDEAAYETAKKGMQAISDYATGTGKDINLLNEKFGMITRSTSSYQSIADQFAGVLPVTSAEFLKQAQAAGFLDESYTKLTEVPVAEYQQAVSAMLEKGTKDLGLAGNTAKEALGTISGSLASTKTSWSNFVTALAGGGDITTELNHLKESIFGVEGASNGLLNNIIPKINEVISSIGKELPNIVQSILPTLMNSITTLLPTMLPALTNTTKSIIHSLAEFIKSDGFKDLLHSITSSIPDIIQAIIECLPDLLDCIGIIISETITALAEAFPEIITMLVDNLPTIIDSIINNLDLIITAIIEAIPILVPAIAEAIIKAIPIILKAVIDLGNKIVEWLEEWYKALLQSVVNFFLDLAAKVPEMMSEVKTAIKEAIQGIHDWLVSKKQDLVNKVISPIENRVNTLKTNILKALQPIIDWLEPKATWINDHVIKPISDFMDKILDKAEALRSGLSSIFGGIENDSNSSFGAINQNVSNSVSSMSRNVTNSMTQAKQSTNSQLTSMSRDIANNMAQAQQITASKMSSIYNAVSSNITAARNTAVNQFQNMAASMSNSISNAGSAIASGVRYMANVISGTHFQFPHINMPHIKVYKGQAPYGIGGIGKLPSFSVEWYAKAYDEAQILSNATIFGMGADGSLLGGGEKSGNEVVVGEQHLLDMMQRVVDNRRPENNTFNIYVEGSSDLDVEEFARLVAEQIQEAKDSKEEVYA